MNHGSDDISGLFQMSLNICMRWHSLPTADAVACFYRKVNICFLGKTVPTRVLSPRMWRIKHQFSRSCVCQSPRPCPHSGSSQQQFTLRDQAANASSGPLSHLQPEQRHSGKDQRLVPDMEKSLALK